MVYEGLSGVCFTASILPKVSPVTAYDHHRPSHPISHLTTMARARLNRPPPPLPRADGALLAAAGIVLFAAAAATALLFYAPRLAPKADTQLQPARIGDVALLVPQDLAGSEHDESGRVVGMVRLRLDWPSFGPVTAHSRKKLLVTLSPPDKVNEPATQLSVYARFLTPTVWSNPGGLVVRGFRKGSPYEGDELYVSVPDGRGFAARCPLDNGAVTLDELCRVTFRHRGMDVNIRFPRAVIADWELMIGGVRRTIDGLMR